VHKVIHAEEIGQVSEIISAAIEPGQAPEVSFTAEVGGDPTVVMEVEVELMTCQLMECRLGGTLLEHPQYYLLKFCRYHLGQLRHSQGC
jgi:hypothetical protein